MVDRRAVVFFAFALACFALIPAALPEHRTIAGVVGAVYALYGVLSWLDAVSRGRRGRRPGRDAD